jgi:DNA gyrase subunit A
LPLYYDKEVVLSLYVFCCAAELENKLIERFQLSDIQCVLARMRLRQLTGLEQDKLRAEYDEM